MAKRTNSRQISEPSTSLMGQACSEVQATIAVWPTDDGIGGRAPARVDTVHIIAFARDGMTPGECESAGFKGGTALIGKTTIREMVRYELNGGVRRDTNKLDKRYARRFSDLRKALLSAARDIEALLPDHRDINKKGQGK